jgi:antitoxin component YwqK of YwqJK toxin-antitoxin module
MEHNKKVKFDNIANTQKISNSYFQNSYLLHNTLLPYFSDDEPLKLINKLFYRLNYERYNTHIQPHGIIETYYFGTKTIHDRKTYKIGWIVQKMVYGLFKKWYMNGKLYTKGNYTNKKLNGILERWYSNGQLKELINYKNGILSGLYERWSDTGEPCQRSNYKDNKLNGLHEISVMDLY